MLRNVNRTYYFIQSGGKVLVASDFAKVWSEIFDDIAAAKKAIISRNATDKGCKGFTDVENGIKALYE